MRPAPVLVLLLLATPALADDTIAAVIGSRVDGKCTIDVGWEAGVGVSGPALEKRARAAHPDATLEVFTHKDNEKKGRSLGRHLVVVSATVKNSTTSCTTKWFGVGFGADEAATKKNALRHLAKRSVWFDDARHTWKVEHHQAY